MNKSLTHGCVTSFGKGEQQQLLLLEHALGAQLCDYLARLSCSKKVKVYLTFTQLLQSARKTEVNI